MKPVSRLHAIFTAVVLMAAVLPARQPGTSGNTPTLAEKTSGFRKFPGFLPFYWNEKTGTIWLEIHSLGADFLYVTSLPAGIGSNDIGLDRGQLGGEHVVRFIRSGPKILLLEPNQGFRAVTEDPDEQKAVEEAFAQSVLWGFEVAAEDGDTVLVDATSFFLRDAHGIIGTLKQTKQGTYRLDGTRSACYLPRTKNFPRNTEVEATLTFTGDDPGAWLRSVVPTPEAVTVRVHHSFVQLPDNHYRPRVFDPRAGFFGISYMDYAAPIGEPVLKQFIARHRLQKKDPSAVMSDAVKPIVYYVDRGAPEPIRSALIEGAGWWNQAFEAAGYRNAFRVELMPKDADPMDIRYNVIQWVHRSTRGWSYGGSVTDPRTGEILKGHVTLGSLRVRQDYLIAEGLLSPYEDGKPVSKDMEVMALARLRQLAAHEVGHTLGLAHNYIASTADRASVMDYPHPLIRINNDGTLNLSNAYAVGIGSWDKVAIAYGYQDFPESTNEANSLKETLLGAMKKGLTFLSDQDARPPGSAHPLVHLWDNGTNAVDELSHMMEVRAIALKRFSENNIRPGMPMATLEEVLVPLYLSHRYQLEAAAKVLGGLTYSYAMRGDGQAVTSPVPAKEQRRALEALLKALTPQALVLPDRIVGILPPRPMGYPPHRELFSGRTGLTFDPLAPAEAVSNQVLGLLLNPERAARLVEHHAEDSGMPDLGEVIDRILTTTWKSFHGTGTNAEIQRVVDNVALYHLMQLAANDRAAVQSRAIATLKMAGLKEWMGRETKTTKDENERAHLMFAIAEIDTFQKNPKQPSLPQPAEAPPGQPIGEEF